MAQSTAARLAAIRKDKFGRRREAARSAATTLTSAGGDAIGLTVEIFVNSAWTDITPYVYYRDFVRISRGRPDETSQIQPQTCTMTVNNRDGRFSPRNPSGPYYGQIGRNTPLRVSRLQNGIRRFRFYGEVTAWPTNSDITGTDVYASITASGMLRRLRQGTPPAYSAMYRAYAFQESPTLFPVAYWPCEDGANSTVIASGLAGMPTMSVSGTPSFAADTSFVCSAPLPVVAGSTWSGQVASYSGGVDNVVRFLMHIPAAGETDGAVIARFYTGGSVYRVELTYGTGGSLALAGYNALGGTLFSTGPTAFNVNGQLLRVSMELTKSGSDIVYQISTYAVSAPSAGSFNGTLSSTSIANVTAVQMNPNGTLTNTVLGHVSVQAVQDSLFDLLGQLQAWITERPTDRFLRLATEQGINAASISYGVSGNEVTLGYQPVDSLNNLIQQIADTDLGFLHESRDQLALAYRERLSLYNQGTAYNSSPTLTLDYSQNNLSAPAVPVDDDAYTRNDVTVTRIGGSSSKYQLTSGSLSIQAPPNGVGPYSTSVSVSLATDAQTPHHANWRLHMGTVDEPRYPQINLNLRHSTFTGNLDTMNAAMTLDIGTRVVINNPPAWLPPDPISLIVQGYQETLGIFEHDMVLNCSPESPYRIWILEDQVLSVADTDGSTLGGPLSTILNGNPFISGASSSGWVGTHASVAVAGSGQANPLPSGSLTPYGLLVTPDGTGNASADEKSNTGVYFAVVGGGTYNASARFYYPSGIQQVFVGIDWFDSSFAFISGGFSFENISAATWTAFSGAFTAPSNAAWGFMTAGIVGPSAGDIFYVTNMTAWQGTASVTTTNPTLGIWTTSAGDFPFDITVGGERMTVTSVTGSSSPQTFTVARGINEVVKSQVAGTDVRLWQPTTISL